MAHLALARSPKAESALVAAGFRAQPTQLIKLAPLALFRRAVQAFCMAGFDRKLLLVL
jgi:hypothetical protein